MTVSVYHPTDRPNFYVVETPNAKIVFSYQTQIAVYPYSDCFIDEDGLEEIKGHRWYVSNNEWSVTTGKHLNWVCEDKKSRLPSEIIDKIVAACFKVVD